MGGVGISRQRDEELQERTQLQGKPRMSCKYMGEIAVVKSITQSIMNVPIRFTFFCDVL